MEKNFSKEASPKKFGFKETIGLLSLAIATLVTDVRFAIASIPETNFLISSCQNTASSSESLDTVGLLAQEEEIVAAYRDSFFQRTPLPDFLKMSKEELIQWIQGFATFQEKLPKAECVAQIEDLFEKETIRFLEEIQQTFQVEYNFANYGEVEIIEMAYALIKGESHPLLDQFWQDLNSRILLNINNPTVKNLAFLKALTEIDRMRANALQYVKRANALQALLYRHYQ